MKTTTIVAMLAIVSLASYVVSAAPSLDYLTTDNCIDCHGTNGNTIYLHHTCEAFLNNNCMYCHTDLSFPPGWNECYNCHADFDHHEDAQHKCNDCHEDRQKQKGWYGE